MGSCCSTTTMYYKPRHFLTKAEKIEILEEYKESLEKEAEGIKERIDELKS